MSEREAWAGYAAAVWAAVFSVLHIVWAAGWHVGLDQELARRAFQQRWFLAFDLVVAALCALATWVALALVQPWANRFPRWLLVALAWGGTGLLALRGGAGALQTLYHIARGAHVLPVFWIWELWFCVGAVLFAVSSWRFSRRVVG